MPGPADKTSTPPANQSEDRDLDENKGAASSPNTAAGVDGAVSDQADDSGMAASKSKDPNRPKRKKAQRACAACQRAHLTCSDSRPCERCISRKIADQCQDGVRKKAKYLHDTPNEILYGNHTGSNAAASNGSGYATGRQNGSHSTAIKSEPQIQNGFPMQPQQMNQPPQQQQQIIQPIQNDIQQLGLNPDQTSPIMPSFASQPSSSVTPNYRPPTQQSPQSNIPFQDYQQPVMDPSDPNLFNFDITNNDFGSHFGALEFGALGDMASSMKGLGGQGNAAASSAFPNIPQGQQQFHQSPRNSTDYEMSRAGNQQAIWQPDNPAVGSYPYNQYNTGQTGFEDTSIDLGMYPAFAIAGRTASFSGASPGSSGSDMVQTFDADFNNPFATIQRNDAAQMPPSAPPVMQTFPSSNSSSTQPSPTYRSTANARDNTLLPKLQQKQVQPVLKKSAGKARKDPSKIYSGVDKPYDYPVAFHALFTYLQRRFPKQASLRIAKAFAAIRPSFISLTACLSTADLIFMEKVFQRLLMDYEDYTNMVSTPTLVCRRTGEVALVGSEFTSFTGWTDKVLLGDAPNLNANVLKRDESFRREESGTNSGGVSTVGSSGRGFNTPRVQAETQQQQANLTSNPQDSTPRRKQPIFLSELLDDKTTVQFFDDYARLAFADRKGSSSGRCKLLQYKTKDRMIFEETNKAASEQAGANLSDSSMKKSAKKAVQLVQGPEDGVQKFGGKDGMIDCMYTWMVKRDVFNIPMMIVINFMPIV